MRTTPAAACEIEASIEPLDLRRDRTILETVERYRRQDIDHPNRKIIENWKEVRRLKQNSLLDVAKKEADKHHLPQEREPEKKI